MHYLKILLCNVTLNVSTLGKLKNCLTLVGIKPATYFASPMLYQLSYEVKLVWLLYIYEGDERMISSQFSLSTTNSLALDTLK